MSAAVDVHPGPAAEGAAVRRRRRPLGKRGAPLLGLLAIIACWYAIILLAGVRPFLLPSPHVVALSLVENWQLLLADSLVTSMETAGGLAMAIVAGVLIAVAMAEIPVLARTLLPWLVVSQAVPKVAIAPLFVIWFGFGATPKIVVACFIAFFPIVVSTMSGLASVQPEERDLFRTITPRVWPLYRHLKIPRALPQFFDGVKVGVTLALVGAVVGEFVASQEGLGYRVIVANRDLDTPLMFASFVALSVIGVLFFYAIVVLEKAVLPWHFARQRVEEGAGS